MGWKNSLTKLRPPVPEPDDDRWDGPDDLWPPEPELPYRPSDPVAEQSVTLLQWGLQLPDGTTAWGGWQGIAFDNPLDRMRMIATLQKTALDMGFAEGDQTTEFLGHYGWAVREAHVTTRFSAVTATYVLGDPAVARTSSADSSNDTAGEAALDDHV